MDEKDKEGRIEERKKRNWLVITKESNVYIHPSIHPSFYFIPFISLYLTIIPYHLPYLPCLTLYYDISISS